MVSKSPYTVAFVSTDFERFAETVDLSFEVLYKPFGVSRVEKASSTPDWLHPGPGTLMVVAIAEDGEILGGARLLPGPGDARRQVRQVAVCEEARTLGVGRALMQALETRAEQEGARELWLNARDTAYGFYSALGYELYGAEFISELTGIPHRAARKRLG